MLYQEFTPHYLLQNLVQCYFVCESDTAGFTNDTVFATGAVELLFNVGVDSQHLKHNCVTSQPGIQLWGQTIEPFNFISSGTHRMFGIRFYPHTAGCFLSIPLHECNNKVLDFTDVDGKEATLLHRRLTEAKGLAERIELTNTFLLKRLQQRGDKVNKLQLVNSIKQDLSKADFFENIHSVASRYGISSRHLQQLFTDYVGISPKLLIKITRFNKSLQLVANKSTSLTSIAHECAYYDQAHFIKDFKFFTGAAPSRFMPETSTEFVAVHNRC